jgi:hypothetical protein
MERLNSSVVGRRASSADDSRAGLAAPHEEFVATPAWPYDLFAQRLKLTYFRRENKLYFQSQCYKSLNEFSMSFCQ